VEGERPDGSSYGIRETGGARKLLASTGRTNTFTLAFFISRRSDGCISVINQFYDKLIYFINQYAHEYYVSAFQLVCVR
jgi:hypothetical protein